MGVCEQITLNNIKYQSGDLLSAASAWEEAGLSAVLGARRLLRRVIGWDREHEKGIRGSPGGRSCPLIALIWSQTGAGPGTASAGGELGAGQNEENLSPERILFYFFFPPEIIPFCLLPSMLH